MTSLQFLVAVVSFISTVQLTAQTLAFPLAEPQPDLNEVYAGSLKSGDLDLDGDIDIVQSGIGQNNLGIRAPLTVYLNDGVGRFTRSAQDFAYYSSTEEAVVGDLDGDGDLDMIVTASDRVDVFMNDGEAQFTLTNSGDLQPAASGELLLGDVDGDGDLDAVQYSGDNNGASAFAHLLLNDGTANFLEASSQVFSTMDLARSAFIDLEGDGDLDLVSFEALSQSPAALNVYVNDGNGNFAFTSTSGLSHLYASDISVGDIDDDGDQDILLTGTDGAEAQTQLYLNNGRGVFTERSNTGFPDLFFGTQQLADLDSDDDLDVLLVGSATGGGANIFALVYENRGANGFSISDSLGGEYIAAATVDDFNGDALPDIIIQGFVDDTNVYWNETMTSSVSKSQRSRSAFTLAPNPATSHVLLSWTEKTYTRLDLIDPSGRVLQTQFVHHQGKHELRLHVPEGVYYVRAIGEAGTNVRKVVVR